MPTEIRQGPSHAEVVRLLQSAALPVSDLTEGHMKDFFYVVGDGSLLGIVGVEFYGENALLRSLVVMPAQRSRGLGQELIERAEQYARERGASKIYLLTTTAESYFRSRGYTVAERDSAPLTIRSTPEFASLCPASSAFLSKQL